TERLLERAGFGDVRFADVHEPVFYGPDVATALALVLGFQATRDRLASAGRADAARAEERLRAALSSHLRGDGVVLDSRAWIITARVEERRSDRSYTDSRERSPT